jgi:hypothetical protein
MVFEVYTTYDYSFHCNGENVVKPTPPPTSHNNVYYQRMKEQPASAMGSVTRNSNGEAYYEFVYSPVLPKPKSLVQEIKEHSVVYYLKRLFYCCEGGNTTN